MCSRWETLIITSLPLIFSFPVQSGNSTVWFLMAALTLRWKLIPSRKPRRFHSCDSEAGRGRIRNEGGGGESSLLIQSHTALFGHVCVYILCIHVYECVWACAWVWSAVGGRDINMPASCFCFVILSPVHMMSSNYQHNHNISCDDVMTLRHWQWRKKCINHLSEQ